jgi:hypothetical protein
LLTPHGSDVTKYCHLFNDDDDDDDDDDNDDNDNNDDDADDLIYVNDFAFS